MNKWYYEAIIQLRPEKSEIDSYIEQAIKKGGVNLSRKKRLKTGLDYYVSSWKFSVALGNELARRFGGRITVSRKLFGRSKMGRVVYRCTVLYRPHPFEKGDVVASGKTVCVVTELGKGITGKNIVTGKCGQLDLKARWQKLKKHRAVVSKNSPRLEVISPEDYQSVAVDNPGKILEQRTVKVVVNEGKVYLVE